MAADADTELRETGRPLTRCQTMTTTLRTLAHKVKTILKEINDATTELQEMDRLMNERLGNDDNLPGLSGYVNLSNLKLHRIDLGASAECNTQAAGHTGKIFQEANIIYKELEAPELSAITLIKQDKHLSPWTPRYLGLAQRDEIYFLKLEDISANMDRETLTIIDIKIGTKTYQPDLPENHEPQERLRAKAANYGLRAKDVTKADFMTHKDLTSTSHDYGIHLEGIWSGTRIPIERCLSFNSLQSLLRSYLGDHLTNFRDSLVEFYKDCQESDLLKTHNLYGSSLLIAIDNSIHRIKMIDFSYLAERERPKHGQQGSVEGHESLSDGYYFGLESLLTLCQD